MATQLRLGLLGGGRWGRNYIRTIAASADVRLARLASRNPDSANLVTPDCVIFADWREMLDARALDGVIVATPPRLHAEMALRAIDAGLPVLIEKPMTMSATAARAVLQLARERGVLAMVGHLHLFSPAYRMLKAMQPAFGSIRAVRGDAGSQGPYRPDVPVLWDWGAHDIAMCLDLHGASPVRVQATHLETREVEHGVGESVAVELAFANDAAASLRWSNMTDRRRRLEVECDRATLIYDDQAAQKLVVSENGRDRAISIASDLPLNILVSEFAAAIVARKCDLSSLELGVAVVEVLAACAQAVSSGMTRR